MPESVPVAVQLVAAPLVLKVEDHGWLAAAVLAVKAKRPVTIYLPLDSFKAIADNVATSGKGIAEQVAATFTAIGAPFAPGGPGVTPAVIMGAINAVGGLAAFGAVGGAVGSIAVVIGMAHTGGMSVCVGVEVGRAPLTAARGKVELYVA